MKIVKIAASLFIVVALMAQSVVTYNPLRPPLVLIPGTGGGSGTVTTVSVASANGFAGSVANPTTTPAITLTTSITGILKGNGAAISAATAGTDYQPPSAAPNRAASCPVTVATSAQEVANNTAGDCTFTLPTITSAMLNANYSVCVSNDITRSGKLTVTPQTGDQIAWNGAQGSASQSIGTDPGGLGDRACFTAWAVGQWNIKPESVFGLWGFI